MWFKWHVTFLLLQAHFTKLFPKVIIKLFSIDAVKTSNVVHLEVSDWFIYSESQQQMGVNLGLELHDQLQAEFSCVHFMIDLSQEHSA